MTPAEFDALINTLRYGSMSRAQLGKVLGEVVGRICNLDAPELEAVQHDLSDDVEAYRNALEGVQEREQRAEPQPEECDAARLRRLCAEPV